MTIYVATTNPGKLRDFAAVAADRVSITPLPDLKEIAPPPEDEPTFEGNARLKAIYYSHRLPGQIVIADDSGLEVDALNGAPGVRSARYADDAHFHAVPPLALDQRNNLYLQQSLQDVPTGQRQARYRCVLAAARDGEILCIASGTVDGEILSTPRGAEGFGYDPLFYLPSQNKTMAELDIQIKLTFSHRGRALTTLLNQLLPGTHDRSFSPDVT